MQVFISSPTSDHLEKLIPDYKINEGKEYDLVLKPGEDGKLDTSDLDSSRLKRLKIIKKRQKAPGSNEERYTINFRNYVGTSEILGNKILVESEKLGADGFEKMLAQITEIVAGLPFDFNSPTYESFEMAVEMPRTVLYHCFNYLRYIMQEAVGQERLSTCILTILLSMKRELERRVVSESIMTGKMDPATIDTLAQTPSNLIQVKHGSSAYDLPLVQSLTYAGKRYIPRQIKIQRSYTTVDTPENRFVKYFLERCNDVVLHFRDVLTSEKNQYVDYPSLREDCDKMSKELSYYLSFPVLRDVGPMRILPMGSTTLQKRGGYREIFGHFSRMNLGAKFPISSDDLRAIIEDKDIARLYEYWCFFKVAGIIKDILGEGQVATRPLEEITEKGVHLRQGPSIEWNGQSTVNLSYNRHFPAKTQKQSYSLGLRPDIVLMLGSSIYLFDAKFKIVTLGKQSDEEIDDIEKEEDTSSTFVNGDVYKMHTYRDAIQGVRAAFVLYPGYQEDFRFYEAEGHTPTERTRIEEMGDVSGVGAVALRPPTLGDKTLMDLLSRIFSSGNSDS